MLHSPDWYVEMDEKLLYLQELQKLKATVEERIYKT